jgi:hypothetical protein
MKTFFIVVLMTGSGLRVYSNYFATPGEDPSPASISFNFSALDDRLVVGFLGGIVPTTKIKFQRLCKTKTRQKHMNYSQQIHILGYIPLKLVKTWLFRQSRDRYSL